MTTATTDTITTPTGEEWLAIGQLITSLRTEIRALDDAVTRLEESLG